MASQININIIDTTNCLFSAIKNNFCIIQLSSQSETAGNGSMHFTEFV